MTGATRRDGSTAGNSDLPEPEALATMRERGGRWFAYRNEDLWHPELGHLKFLQCGEGRTYTEPPKRLPDMPDAINWRYWLIGRVDMKTGEIVKEAA